MLTGLGWNWQQVMVLRGSIYYNFMTFRLWPTQSQRTHTLLNKKSTPGCRSCFCAHALFNLKFCCLYELNSDVHALPAEVNRCQSVQTGVYFRMVEVGQLVARERSLGVAHVTRFCVSPVFLLVSSLGSISLLKTTLFPRDLPKIELLKHFCWYKFN